MCRDSATQKHRSNQIKNLTTNSPSLTISTTFAHKQNTNSRPSSPIPELALDSTSSSPSSSPTASSSPHKMVLPLSTIANHNKAMVKEIMKRRTLQKANKSNTLDYFSYLLLGLIIFITIFTFPYESQISGKVTLHHVWYNGWITAVATGLGVVPFFFINEPNKFWMGISNAIAGGMMISASISLVMEGAQFEEGDFGMLSLFPGIENRHHSMVRTSFGFLLGLVFILGMKSFLDQYEDLKTDINGANASKMILIIVVMTLHSLSEGIGIGVSFGGQSGMKLGQFISLSLAFHNIPEGLAVGLVLTSQKVSNIRTVLWAIFTSIPQPLFAIPAYMFVEKFAPLLPGGLGFAAGAMSYVAVFELLIEAAEDTASITTTGITAGVSFLVMNLLQEFVRNII